MSVRTTIYLDEEIIARARRFVPPRGLSHLLNELLTERLAQFEREEIEAQMREGYIAVRDERQELNEDWQTIDGEGWPE